MPFRHVKTIKPSSIKQINGFGNVIDKAGDWLAEYRDWLLLFFILMYGLFLRLWRIDRLPPGLHPEEVERAGFAQNILEGNVTVFDPVFGEPLFGYLQAIAIGLSGIDAVSLRVVPVLLGLATIYMTYLAARSWFSYRVGLLAAFFAATSVWGLHLSRIGHEAVVLSLAVPLLMWLGYKAFRSNKAAWYVALGLAFGLGFYLSAAFFAALFALTGLLAFSWYKYRDNLREYKQPILIVLLSTLSALLPLMVYAILNPSTYLIRGIVQRSLDAPMEAVGSVVSSLWDTLLMFHFSGSRDHLFNLGGEPVLNALIGVALIFGLLVAFRKWHDWRYGALLLVLISTLLPGGFTTDVSPDAVLSAGAFAPVLIVASIGLSELLTRWRGVFPRNALAQQTAVIVILSVIAFGSFYDFQRYFVAWGNSPQTLEVFQEETRATASYINTHPTSGTYLLLAEDTELIRILAGNGVTITGIDTGADELVELEPDDRLITVYPHTAAQIDIHEGSLIPINRYTSPYRPHITLFEVFAIE